jgi:hypothetical protein
MKTNFKSSKTVTHDENFKEPMAGEKKDFTEEEFEEFILKTGAAGSYMVFRSAKKDDELGLDEL